MKTLPPHRIVVLAGLVLVSLSFSLHAQETPTTPIEYADGSAIQRVFFEAGKLSAVSNSVTILVETNFALPRSITLTTNATFQVGKGKDRQLVAGQVMNLTEGTLLGSDGSLSPIEDHVVVKNGRPMLVKDGEAAPVDGEVALSNGARIGGDGMVTNPDGSRVRLLDGQLFKMDGSSIAAKDTVTLKDGKVMVQKDGSLLQVAPGRTLVMSDGTRVLGDGALIKPDGTRVQLAEGETVTVEGVVRR
jgi:hypothetical protein